MEEKIRKEYLRRVRLLLRTELNGRNKIDLELEIQRMWQMKTEVIYVVVGVLGPIKRGMVENITRVSERVTVTRPKRSACWDLHKSSGRCLMYDQNE